MNCVITNKFNPSILSDDRRLISFKTWLDPLVVTSPQNALFIPYYACWACGILASEKIPTFVEQLCAWYPTLLPYEKDTPEFRRLCKALNAEREKVSADGKLIPYDSLHDYLSKHLSPSKSTNLYTSLQRAVCSLCQTCTLTVIHR